MHQETSHPKPFKAQVVQECPQPGASVASVTMNHGINANVVRNWLPLSRDLQLTDLPAFFSGEAGTKHSGRKVRQHRVAIRTWNGDREMAGLRSCWLCRIRSRSYAVIRIDAIWLATEPMDMRAGTDTALARVVAVFGAAQPHCAYLFANRRANRMKVLVHDGLGIWLAARRLHQGKFFWPGSRHGSQIELGAEQLHALVLGLPWQRVGPGSAISIV
ncbi:IS66 Orf2 like protein [compost metagenome]